MSEPIDVPESIRVYAEYTDMTGSSRRTMLGLVPLHGSDAFHVTGIIRRLENTYQEAITDTP